MRISTRHRIAAVVAVGVLLVLTGGPGRFWRRAAPREAGEARARRIARTVPYRLQSTLDPVGTSFSVEYVRAIRLALFMSGVSTRDEIEGEAAALASPHLLIRLAPARGTGVRLVGTVARQPLGTLTSESLRRCGENVASRGALEQGAVIGALVARFVECYRQFADSVARPD